MVQMSEQYLLSKTEKSTDIWTNADYLPADSTAGNMAGNWGVEVAGVSKSSKNGVFL